LSKNKNSIILGISEAVRNINDVFENNVVGRGYKTLFNASNYIFTKLETLFAIGDVYNKENIL
jgi:hypothetical protein